MQWGRFVSEIGDGVFKTACAVTSRPAGGHALIGALLFAVGFAPSAAEAAGAAWTPTLMRAAWLQPATETDDGTEDLRYAMGLYGRQRWKLAAESFQDFIKRFPKHPKLETARFHLGLTLISLDQPKDARDVLRKFLTDYPTSKDAIEAGYWVGECSFLTGDYPSAAKELSAFVGQAAADHPLFERALPHLGELELRQNRPDTALKYFGDAIEKFPKGRLVDDAKFGKARALEASGKMTDAIKLYEELANNTAGNRAAEALLNLGGRHFDDGSYNNAVATYQRFEKLYPNSSLLPLAQLNLGYSYYRQGDPRSAIQQFDRLLTDQQYGPEAWLWRGMSFKGLNEHGEAIVSFKKGAEQYKDSPYAERFTYQWADTEQRRGNGDAARKLYLEVATRWPKGTLADQSLYAACVSALGTGKADEAEQLLEKIEKDYPETRFRPRLDLVRGRLLLAKNDLAGAQKLFESVVATGDNEATRLQGRYYQASVAQKRGEHKSVLELTDAVVASFTKGVSTDLAPVYVLRANSELALGKLSTMTPESRRKYFASALDQASKYLEKFPEGEFADQAHMLRALAAAHNGDKTAALADFQKLKQGFPTSVAIDTTLLELGEVAFANEDFAWAEQMYRQIANGPKASKFRPRGLTELGWTLFKQKKFDDASVAFAEMVKDYGQDELASEASFMLGSSLQDGGKLPEAQQAFRETFQKYEGAKYGYLAGLQVARLLNRQKKPAEADAAYVELFKKYPKPDRGDHILNEWAVVNYAAGRYERSDEIFRMLASDYPMSPLADDAQLSLAESDLVQGKLDEARTQFRRLADGERSDDAVKQRALYQLSRVELDQKKWREAAKVCQDLAKSFPESPYRLEMQFREADAAFHLDEFDQAAQLLKELKSAQSDRTVSKTAWFPQVWVLLAEVQFRQKKYAEVAQTADDLVKWNPRAESRYQIDEILGRSFKAQARFPEARQAFLRVIHDEFGRNTATAAKSQFLLADTYLLEKDYSKALREYVKVEVLYKFEEWQAPALYQAAACHEELRQWKDAFSLYESLIKQFPDSDYVPKAKERMEMVRPKLAG